MSDVADTFEPEQADATQDQAPPAGAQQGGPSIPKWRFDEVNDAYRETKQELQALRELVNQRLPQQPVAQPQAQEPDYTQYGLDPDQGRAFMALAQQAAKQTVAQDVQVLRAHIGKLANQNEEFQFLHAYGRDKDKLIPQIRDFQRQYAQKYGSYIPMEHAYVLVTQQQQLRAQGQASRRAPAPTQNTQPIPQAQAPGMQAEADMGDYPGADLTRTQPRTSAGVPAQSQAGVGLGNRSFDELSLEDMEAALDGSIQAGSIRI